MARRNNKIKPDETAGLEAVESSTAVSNELDKVIHERMRLGIISALAANKKLSFGELKKLLDTTDGNISVHARKLEDAGYLSTEKSFQARKPLTEYQITASGRDALKRYLDHMEALIAAVRDA
jgi:DNA-binding MarR family transcriptional regulator